MIDKYRREAEDARNRIYEAEQDAQRVQQESVMETEKTKIKMHHRLSELEPLAEMLKSTELRLQEAQDRLFTYERRASEHTKLIAELTQKVESQTDQLEHMREKYRLTQDEYRSLQGKYESVDR
ncbi:predicted protein [Nematostella vectensis]|uniref:Uncharacterized protein n=1 Tax=Nematostella vectensis TaxID=45351 RepID=A7SDL4_NEMVE|nr:predicted protein [Nematostella vectensis]|eukprot:XP_001630247.1 predicted protein [Nematostella vectensis]